MEMNFKEWLKQQSVPSPQQKAVDQKEKDLEAKADRKRGLDQQFDAGIKRPKPKP